MAEGVFEVSVLTPEAQLLSAEARALVLRSSDGDLTVLDGHTALVTDVVPGDVRVDPAEGEPVHLAVHGGYLHVETGTDLDGTEGRSTRATLLAGTAELAERIDVARAERAREQAEARLEELRAMGRGSSGGASHGGASHGGGGHGGGGHGGGGHGGGAEGGTGGDGEHAVAPEDLELAETEAALRRAEVRLAVAGAPAGSAPGAPAGSAPGAPAGSAPGSPGLRPDYSSGKYPGTASCGESR
jgi:F-type H+-transporting ATPase subunit epsilon